MRLLGDSSTAEDCVSETFSRFLKALQAGRGPRDYLKYQNLIKNMKRTIIYYYL
jgi:DNA-directed RNA polymerase specialized sigma24 family protein